MTDEQTREKIVAGVDGSEQSRRALRWAMRQAELTGAVLEAVIAWEPPFSGWGGNVRPDEENALADQARKVLVESIEKVSDSGPAVEVTARVLEGTPAQVLLKAAADDGVALLVVGSRGLGGFTGALLGSVGQHCAQHAPCPVVIVRGP
ncbi:universal stress protein [Kitasatospora sp. RB6PN24]|uniref:universal stress protein n=1 Tax=Kitasatospora humi TaxID=2893891 RepID=UPI001E2A98A6|nr:universal stress protein [Kitasatospora humi]MCC9309550.1 universal stress protein [Kitasatospora humi]